MNELSMTMRCGWRGVRVLTAALIALLTLVPALAGPLAQAGPYKVEVATDPAVIAVGESKLLMRVTDASGKPVDGATVSALVKMPTMDMGEVERRATPVAGQPGVYEAPTAFAMAGEYEATVKVTGPNGAATGKVALRTGQDTGGLSGTAGAKGGPSPVRFLPWILLLGAAAFTVYRMRKTGQHLNWKSLLHWQFLVGLGTIIILFLVARYAVENWRRPGSMTPLEAQGMEMSTPAPPGTAPVGLATVTDGPISSAVTYTGQAVGYIEQDITPRVRGWITWMPFYVGDQVRKGQVLARLDTSEIQPQIAEKQAMATMAEQGVTVARAEDRQALEDVNRMRAELRAKTAGLRDARAGITGARAERAEAESDLVGAQTMLVDAKAEAEAATAQNEYAQAQAQRTKNLQQAGAASGEETQRDQAMAADAAAKARQGQARVNRATAEIRAKQNAILKADAMIEGAHARLAQMTADAEAARAQIRVSQAAVDAARARLGQAYSGIDQARAAVATTTTQAGYSEIRSLVDGVITQRLISPGTLVNAGQAILKVAQVTPIRLQANIAQTDLQKVRVGSLVTVAIQGDPGKPVSALVTSVAPSLDSTSRTGVVEAVVPNRDRRFSPGEYVVMSISVGKRASSLHVPTMAVHWRTPATGDGLATQTTPYVWVAEPSEGGRFTVRMADVAVGLTGGAATAITSGLKEGQKVVTVGASTLSDGDTVAPIGSPAALSTPSSTTSPAPGSMPGMKM